jgi:prepilin-type N-terminal cleavage/methylation domain-containing protein
MHIPCLSRGAAPRRVPGFTLIELMVALAIGAVLTAIAAPSFKGTFAKYRMQTESSNLLDSLLLAREEARNSASPVSVCRSSDGTSCGATAWRGGHIVFRDGGTAGVVDGTDVVIRRVQAAREDIAITTTLQQSGNAFSRGYLQFVADGKLDIKTAVVFTTCQSSYLPLLTAVQFNGSTSSSKGTGNCP